jgi:hypothetical protein
MKDHLKKSVISYSKIQEEKPINPISNTDAEIIVELIEALKKLGKTDLVAILDGWKYKKDTDVRDDLLTWNTEYNSEANQEERQGGFEVKMGKFGGVFINGMLYTQQPIRNFIELQGSKYELEHIFNYSKVKEWCYEPPVGIKFGIKINEYPDDVNRKGIYADKKIFYNTEEERNIEYDKLNRIFISLDNVRIIE